MKKIALATVAAACVAGIGTSAFAADLAVKAPPMVAPPVVSPWDVAFGGALMTDYVFRGISQSARSGSVAAYVEPRYNVLPNLQLYAGVAGESIKFANDAAAEIDVYGGFRPTFGPLAFDFGFWYYAYPDGSNSYYAPYGDPLVNFLVPALKDQNFYEVYGKVTWTINDFFAIGGNVFYTPSFLNTGADGTYFSATAKLTAPAGMLPYDVGAYVSGEIGRQELGTTDVIPLVYTPAVDLPSYTTWNVGLGFTWKAFTLDLRYIDTDLSEENCFVLTGDPDASRGTLGLGSNWCGETFVAKLSFDTSILSLK
ncbi:hypothetical protein A33M_3143 [Rhodovulum sp. PH10]|uniref:TorF family putative porin n=1 Tax=Rhodovulum sp. PH10 TaxID=1187851 RepID=UPI00027C21F7|nr:TorF family putative porin [Rhodovulum sp. PH10]EJW11431.1 hypothetical protein A33M_3143 [Rhodovulum sp. PH10]